MPITIDNHKTVAETIADRVRTTQKSQAEIALALGYENPNIINMFMQGRARIPLSQVGQLARVLDVDQVLFLKQVMGEYMPDTLRALQSVIEEVVLMGNERKLIDSFCNLERQRN